MIVEKAVLAQAYLNGVNILWDDPALEDPDGLVITSGSLTAHRLLSAVPLVTLAAEIALKALKEREDGTHRRTHNLWHLFRDLSEQARIRLEVQYLAYGPTVDMEELLKGEAISFLEWRYLERPGISVNVSDLIRLTSAALDLALEGEADGKDTAALGS